MIHYGDLSNATYSDSTACDIRTDNSMSLSLNIMDVDCDACLSGLTDHLRAGMFRGHRAEVVEGFKQGLKEGGY